MNFFHWQFFVWWIYDFFFNMEYFAFDQIKYLLRSVKDNVDHLYLQKYRKFSLNLVQMNTKENLKTSKNIYQHIVLKCFFALQILKFSMSLYPH